MEHNINHKYFEGVNFNKYYTFHTAPIRRIAHWLCAVRTAILSGVTWHLRWVIRVPRKKIGDVSVDTPIRMVLP